MAFSKTNPFTVSERQEKPEGSKSELERLQVEWQKALEEGFQSRILPALQLKQDGRPRLFFVLTQQNTVQGLKTTTSMRCIRDDLLVYDVEIAYTNIPYRGIMQEAEFRLVRDPKSVGVDPTEIVKLINRTIKGAT